MAENAIISDLEFAPQLTDDMVLAVEDTQNTYSTTLGDLRGQLNKIFVEKKNIDFNTLVDDGFYQASGSLTNAPIVGSLTWLLQVVKNGEIIIQTAFSNGLDDYLNVYRRRWNGSTWGQWEVVGVNKDLSNITAEASTNISNSIMPDYVNGLVIISREINSYTIQKNGWIFYQSGGANSGEGSRLYINDTSITFVSKDFWVGSSMLLVKKDDVVRLADNTYGIVWFYPFMGEN